MMDGRSCSGSGSGSAAGAEPLGLAGHFAELPPDLQLRILLLLPTDLPTVLRVSRVVRARALLDEVSLDLQPPSPIRHDTAGLLTLRVPEGGGDDVDVVAVARDSLASLERGQALERGQGPRPRAAHAALFLNAECRWGAVLHQVSFKMVTHLRFVVDEARDLQVDIDLLGYKCPHLRHLNVWQDTFE